MSERWVAGEWIRHDLHITHASGQESVYILQTDGRQYVLSEHRDNQGPHVSQFATKWGDRVIRSLLKGDAASKPEDFILYAERLDQRFDRWEAKTTKREYFPVEGYQLDGIVTEWRWANPNPLKKSQLEVSLGVRLVGGQSNYSHQLAEEQTQVFHEASHSGTMAAEALRQAVPVQPTRPEEDIRR